MMTVWMDPEQAKAVAATLGELAMQIQETVSGTRTECTCGVPRSHIGRLDGSLQAITVGALKAALGYLEQAVELKTADGKPVWAPRNGAAPLPRLTPAGMSELIRNGKADVGPGVGGGDPNILAEISGQQSATANTSASFGGTTDTALAQGNRAFSTPATWSRARVPSPFPHPSRRPRAVSRSADGRGIGQCNLDRHRKGHIRDATSSVREGAVGGINIA